MRYISKLTGKKRSYKFRGNGLARKIRTCPTSHRDVFLKRARILTIHCSKIIQSRTGIFFHPRLSFAAQLQQIHRYWPCFFLLCRVTSFVNLLSRAVARIFLAVFTPPLTTVFFTSFYCSRHPRSMSVVLASILYYFLSFYFTFFYLSLYPPLQYPRRPHRRSPISLFYGDVGLSPPSLLLRVTLSCAALPPRGIVTSK